MKQSGRANVVEINGRLYDAKTGLPVKKSDVSKSAPKPEAHQIKKPVKRPSIDGFSAPKHNHKPKLKKAHPAQATKPTQPRTVSPEVKSVHKKPERSHTLQRDLVSKPKHVSTPHHEARREQAVKKPVVTDSARAERAKAAQKSSAISRFAQNASAEIKQEVEQIAATVTAPIMGKEPARPISPAPAPPTSQRPVEPPKRQTNRELKEELIRARMDEAEADEVDDKPQRFKRIRSFVQHKPKTASIMATATAAVLVVGYVVYLNIPNMALRIAASRAGFEASLPGYTPSGYKFSGPIAYSPGQISIEFSSNTDDREFTITQKQTSWDSQSLLDNYVAEESPLYQTYQERGLTIYIYDGSSAAWVNGGVWYTVDGDSLLNSEQLIKIASSL